MTGTHSVAVHLKKQNVIEMKSKICFFTTIFPYRIHWKIVFNLKMYRLFSCLIYCEHKKHTCEHTLPGKLWLNSDLITFISLLSFSTSFTKGGTLLLSLLSVDKMYLKIIRSAFKKSLCRYVLKSLEKKHRIFNTLTYHFFHTWTHFWLCHRLNWCEMTCNTVTYLWCSRKTFITVHYLEYFDAGTLLLSTHFCFSSSSILHYWVRFSHTKLTFYKK